MKTFVEMTWNDPYVTQNPDTTLPFVSLEMMFANDDLAMIVANNTPEVMTQRKKEAGAE